jgi:hypothetical protein
MTCVSRNDEIAVPDVVGMEEHAARTLIAGTGLCLTYGERRPLVSGTVIRQRPDPGTTVHRGTAVEVWVKDVLERYDFGPGTLPTWPHTSGPSGPTSGVREPRRPAPASGADEVQLVESE